jgi:hypothetical protein
MKIRITQPGWAGFTGLLGHTEFKDGVSVDDLGKGDIHQIAACVSVEEIDAEGEATGVNPSIAQVIIDRRTMTADLVDGKAVLPPTAPADAAPARVYTEAELAEVADKDGIKGVRAISDPMGITGKSIAEIVGKVLAAQAEKAAKAEAAAREAAVQAELEAKKAAGE